MKKIIDKKMAERKAGRVPLRNKDSLKKYWKLWHENLDHTLRNFSGLAGLTSAADYYAKVSGEDVDNSDFFTKRYVG